MKKSKIPKLSQNIGLGKLFLEKKLLVRLDFYFYFTRTATQPRSQGSLLSALRSG